MSLEKCVDFVSSHEKGLKNGLITVESNLRESINNLFIDLSTYMQDGDIDYTFDVYSLIYNLHVLVKGNNGGFNWGFLPKFNKVSFIESTNLESSIAKVSSDITQIQTVFGQFPITYQVHPFKNFECPQELKKCYEQDNVQYNLRFSSQPAMEELLYGTYGLTAVMRNDLGSLIEHECFGKQLLQAYYQDVITRGKLHCAELYSTANIKASNDPALESVREIVDTACQVFDSTPTWFDDQYNCVLRPSGCSATHDVNLEG